MASDGNRELQVIEELKRVDTTAPVDRIIQQVRNMLRDEVLKPGDRLPSEKRLEESTGIKRGVISRAFRYLESYGILRTVPQSGTYVAAIGFDALQGLLANIITLESHHLESLMEVRQVLDAYAAEQACRHATDEELQELAEVHRDVAAKIEEQERRFDEDLVFHLKIAELSKNPALKSFISLLTSQAIGLFAELEKEIPAETLVRRFHQVAGEHRAILDAILARDEEAARNAIAEHYRIAREFRARYRDSESSPEDSTTVASGVGRSPGTDGRPT